MGKYTLPEYALSGENKLCNTLYSNITAYRPFCYWWPNVFLHDKSINFLLILFKNIKMMKLSKFVLLNSRNNKCIQITLLEECTVSVQMTEQQNNFWYQWVGVDTGRRLQHPPLAIPCLPPLWSWGLCSDTHQGLQIANNTYWVMASSIKFSFIWSSNKLLIAQEARASSVHADSAAII